MLMLMISFQGAVKKPLVCNQKASETGSPYKLMYLPMASNYYVSYLDTVVLIPITFVG